MSQYTAAVPEDGQVRAEIRTFFEKFYEVSDSPGDHEKYADMFTKNGKLIMGPNEVNGREEIVKMRQGMWEKVAKRSHKPLQIYAFGSGADDVMLHGTVGYVLKDDRKTETVWGAKAHFVKEDSELRMDFYQVFLVRHSGVFWLWRKLSLTVAAGYGGNGASTMMWNCGLACDHSNKDHPFPDKECNVPHPLKHVCNK